MEEHLGLSGDEILYVGDHIYADVHVSSQIRRWRTALVLRELEHEIAALQALRCAVRTTLEALMDEKQALEREQAQLRLSLQRAQLGYADPSAAPIAAAPERLRELRARADRARRAHRAAGTGRERAGQSALGAADARRQRQKSPRAPNRALRGHLHVARVEPARSHAVRVLARARAAACRTTRESRIWTPELHIAPLPRVRLARIASMR